MRKIVFQMVTEDVGKDLVGMTPATAVELGAEVESQVVVKKGDKSVTLKVKTYPDLDLNPRGVLLDKKTREKLGVVVAEPFEEPDFVEVEKA